MALNDDQVRELLRWFVNSSETYKNWMPDRIECEKYNHQWIQPEIIKKMSDEDLRRHYLDYFNNGTGKKQKLIAIPREKIIQNDKFRDSLLYLLNEEIDIQFRINELLYSNKERHIDGMGKALITAFLMDFKPDKYCLWNGKTEMGLNSLEWGNLFHQRGDTSGDIYIKIMNLFKKLKEIDPELNLTNLSIDLFLHTISATEEGEKILEKIIGPSELKIRYFIEKTLKNHNSNKPEEIDEIRYLFEKGIPKYLGNIANNLDKKYENRFYIVGGVGNPKLNSIDSFEYLPQITLYDNKARENDRFSTNQFYVIYIVREDRKGIYLSLNHGQQYMKNILKENGNYKTWFGMESDIRSEASKLREKLGIDHNFYDTMDLGAVNASSAKMYEAASICSKYYTLENLPSEEELVSDFKEFLRLYGSLSSNEPFLTVIEDKNEIKNAQRRFLDILLERADDIISTSKITTFGKVNAYWSNDLGIWFVNRELGLNRYFNGFGIDKPNGLNIPVICEINIPKGGIDKNVAGAFAEDIKGNIYLIHRGIIVGINKNDFLDKYAGELAQIQDGEIKTSAVVISDLNDPKLPEKVRDFVFEVDRIKRGKDVKKLNFLDYLNKEGFYFEPELIENFLLSLKVKPFVILTGNSGTGKTKIAQLFAKYINPSPKKLNEKYIEIGSINRSLTSYSQKNNGGWRFKPDELILNRNPNLDLNEDLDDLILELRNDNESIRGNGYIKQKKQSYSEDIQFYLYYYDNSDFYEAINKLENNTVTIHILQKINSNDGNKKYEIVPVGANWTENRHIVGFFNVITGKYQRTKALDLIIKSQNDEFSPYFLILDEMNLSHVERYFSDFLSAIESNEAVELHLSKDIKDVPNEIKFYDNLIVIGTVNVDETTYMFSPKVLDRANTIEFPTPSAEGYMNGQNISNSLNGSIEYLEDPLSDIGIRKKSLNELKELFGNTNTPEGKFWDIMAIELEEFQNVLKKVNFDFGFRVINEIMRFMYVAWKYEGSDPNWNNWKRYFDTQIKQKMLPRIHGSQRTLENTLDKLIGLCNDYPTSKAKLEQMNEVLKKQRYVSFTN